MGKKLNAFITGALALIGVGLPATTHAGVVRSTSEITSIQNVDENAPFFLEKFAQPSAQSDKNLVSWHESHASHASHASHSSHVSHQSGY